MTSFGSADHNAPAPANQQQFIAGSGATESVPGCGVPQVIKLVHPQWTTSDSVDVQISSADDATNWLATCV